METKIPEFAATLETVNFSGHVFSDFFAARDTAAPGWFVFGRNAEKYGRKPDGRGAYVMLCGRPDVAPRRARLYNNPVRRGWRTRREAMAFAAWLNGRAAV